VATGVVDQFQWLTAAQMIDGLALGETTPGPLIMVVSFVGFVGGWTKAIFGVESLFFLWCGGGHGGDVFYLFTVLPFGARVVAQGFLHAF
jgi:chromate transporter